MVFLLLSFIPYSMTPRRVILWERRATFRLLVAAFGFPDAYRHEHLMCQVIFKQK